MKKFIVMIPVFVGLLTSTVSADALKNSLTNIMEKDDSTQMIDLGNINLNAKPKPVKKIHRNRSPETVIGTVNEHRIIKKDADGYLSQRTQGKVTDYDTLPPIQQEMLLREMGLPYIAYYRAQKELTALEKETILNRTWMQKEARKIEIKDDEVRVVYDKLKQQFIDNNNTQNIPKFELIKDSLRMQMIEKKMMTELMENVKIKVVE